MTIVANVREARQASLLETVREFWAKHNRAPTIRELATLMGMGETRLATIHGDLQELVARGDLEAIQVPYGVRTAYKVKNDRGE